MLVFVIKLYHYGFRCIAALPLLLLLACGNNYQAPVVEQGDRLVIASPIIVDSSSPGTSANAAASRARVVAASSASSASARTGGAVNSSVVTAASRHLNLPPKLPPNLPPNHRVRTGDTLYSIAFQYDLDARNLAIANSLRPPYTIFIGQELNLDLSRISNTATRTAVDTSNLGTEVNNNSVARAQATATPGTGLTRQAIGSSGSVDPDWQWPHTGRVLRAFQSANKGIDIGGQVGDPVWAASAGEVVYSGNGIQGTGDLIIIRHGDSYLSAYAHNSVMLVSEGHRVGAGDKIAEVGENPSGVAMLHFEIRVDGTSVDPIRFLPQR